MVTADEGRSGAGVFGVNDGVVLGEGKEDVREGVRGLLANNYSRRCCISRVGLVLAWVAGQSAEKRRGVGCERKRDVPPDRK